MDISIDYARHLDETDPLKEYRKMFHIPPGSSQADKIYLCGNSLGLQPKTTREAILIELDDWARLGVDGHLEATNPWLPYHELLSANMAEVVGALNSEVVVMNTLTANLHLMMVSFYRPTVKKYKILIERKAFPSDIYAVASQLRFHGYDANDGIVILESESGDSDITREDFERTMQRHGEEIALIMIGGVNYYTGQYFDLPYITEIGHRYGCMVGFDLAHGAGNIFPDLHQCGADFAIWCNYKYLNSGPGAPGGVFVHERHADWGDRPRFEGWWGNNKKNRFTMLPKFESLIGAEAWQLSNPPILALAPIKASLEIFHQAGMNALRAKSKLLTSFALACLEQIDDNFNILIPADESARGCQLSLQMKQPDKRFFKALNAMDIVADWRDPDVIRIAPVPLYNTFEDVYNFADRLKSIKI